MNSILTERFELIPASTDVVEALIAGDTVRAGELLGVKFPDGWPLEDEAQAGLLHHLEGLRNNPAELEWRIRLIVRQEHRKVVGSVSFKGCRRQMVGSRLAGGSIQN